MLYDLVQTRGGKNTVFMTDTLTKVKARKKQLQDSQRGAHHNYEIRPAAEDSEKYRKPPNMNFCPSGDAGTKKYRNRVAKAKQIKKNNPKRERSEIFPGDRVLITPDFVPGDDTQLVFEATVTEIENSAPPLVHVVADEGEESSWKFGNVSLIQEQ